MASEDGSLTIKVKLDASGVESGLEKVKKKTKEVGEEAERSGEKTKEPLEEIPKEVPKTTSALDKLKAKIAAVGDKMKTLQPAASKLASGIGTSAKAGAAALATAAASATAGIVAVGKQALDSYAQYEQMVGGIDKLFGTGPAQTLDEYAESVGKSAKSVEGEFNKLTKASQTVQKNAQNAFKTAGMSANSYMESVTGFSAALINSLGGDTQKAANMADVAMRSISDNANTFGTDTQNLVETYQSLAKGNYAMLDNLKLSYGGTKTELERMMKDANEYAAQNKDIAEEVGVNGKLQVSSFADIVAAIELMQRKQGIAGTTAREAATTIEGSVNTAKAAWENWVTELGKDDADVSARTDELVDSVVTAASNIIPRLGTIMESLGTAVADELPRIGEMAAEAAEGVDIGDAIEKMLTGGADLATAIGDTISNTDFSQVANDLLTSIGNAVGSVDWGSAAAASNTAIMGVISDTIQGAADYIDQNGATILTSVLGVVMQVAGAIVSSLPKLLTAVGSVLNAVIDSVLGLLGNLAAQALTAAGEAAKGIEQGFYDGLQGLADSVGQQVQAAVDSVGKFAGAMLSAGQDLVNNIVSGVISIGGNIAAQVGAAIESAKSFVGNMVGQFKDVGANIIHGIVNGVTSAASGLVNSIVNAAKGALDAAKSALGIHSPSRVFRDEVGKQIAAGVIDGITAMTPALAAASSGMAQSAAAAGAAAAKATKTVLSKLGTSAEKQLTKTDKALDKLAKQMGKKAKAASEKQYKDVYKAAKSGLEKVEKKHSVSYRQQADYWAKVGKKAKDGSALQEKYYAKMAKAAEKYAASLTLGEQKAYYADLAAAQEKQAAATEKSYKAEEKRVKALKKAAEAAKSGSSEQKKLKAEYDKANESLKKQETRLKSQKERLSDTKEELKDVRKQIKEAAADAKDAFLGVEETSTKSLKDIKEELADTIADLQQQYQDAVQATADSITGSLDIFKEFSSESTGSAETLIANMRSQAQATDDYKAVIEDLKAKVESGQISQTLFDELAAKGIDSLADLKTVNSMTESQLKEYAELFEKTRQDALNASKTLNEDLYKDTQDKIAKAKDDALAEALKSYQAYEAKLKELGKKVSKTVEKQYKDDQAAMDALAATGKDKLTELAESYAKAFGDDILEQTKGYERYTTSAMEAAAKATEDSVKKQEETVKTGTTLITKTVQTAMDTQYAAVSGTMSSMESSVASTVSRIQSMMAEINSIQAAANARESSVSSQLASARASAARQSSKASAQSAAQGSPVALSMPTAPQVNWYAAGGIFNSPQVIGIGEQGTEFALRDYHLDAIAERMGSTQQADFDRAISRLVNALPGIIKKSTPDSISVNKREFGRLVREV